MKKLLLVCLSVMASVAAFGQQVNFNNTGATLIRTNDGAGHIGNITGANQWRIGLYIAPQGTANESLFTLVAIATNSSLSAGRIGTGGGNLDMPSAATIAYQVKAWSLGAGATYDLAVANSGFPNKYTGKSTIGSVTPAVAPNAPTALFSQTAGAPEFAGQLASGFDLTTIPEPSSIALGLLGLGAIALFRRRK